MSAGTIAPGVTAALAHRLGDVGLALASAGWSVRFLAPVGRCYPVEARKGSAVVYLPQGADGQDAPSVHAVGPDGEVSWCCALSGTAPGVMVLRVAEMIAGQ